MDNSLYTEAENSKVEELREQVTRLEGLLLKKRKQIETLRTALKPHEKTTANLKRKSENEKLRHKLKLLKKDAATFSSLKAGFEARCAEYCTKVEGLQLLVGIAKDERKTIRQFLDMTIEQNVILSRRLAVLVRNMLVQSRITRNARRPENRYF